VSVAMGDDGDDGLPDRLPHVVPGADAARRGPGETVRRQPALVSLSEEHRQELAHARRLLRAGGAGPEERLAVAGAYVDAFFTETVEHFRREEEILFPLYVRHAGSTPVLERILREHMELHGLVRALVNNMVEGVTKGFERKLEINGVGYKAEVAGDKMTLALGYSHPIVYHLPKGISAKVEKNLVTLTGSDRELLGQTAAKLRSFRPPEPYKGKGIKYLEEYIKRKVGKTGAA